MGLIIKTEINTDGGSISNSYMNISKFEVDSESEARVYLNLYENKAIREEDPIKNLIFSKSVVRRFGLSKEELDKTDVYNSMYTRLKSILEESNLEVEDDL
jgi:hypothetical protein